MSTEGSTDEQGNIIAQIIQKLEIGKKAPQSVFSWPSFITNAKTSDVMKPVATPIRVRSTESIRNVLWVLIKNKIQCVPVYNETTRRYVGFVDLFDVVQYISNAAGSAIAKPDFFQIFKRRRYGDVPVSNITNTSSKDYSDVITATSSLGPLLDFCLATNLRHIPVIQKQKFLGLVSQARIVKFLAENRLNFPELANTKLKDLTLLGTDNVYTVEDSATAISAFVYMMEKGVQGLAVVNSEGRLVDSIHSFDVKELVFGDFFSDLRQPVLNFLSKSRILLSRNLAPIVCTPEDSVAEVLLIMAQENVSRVFMVDSNRVPIQAVSLRDILKVFHALPNLPNSSVGLGKQGVDSPPQATSGESAQ